MKYQFDNHPNKTEAREINVEFFRQKTGLKSIPKGQCYLTLCGLQTDKPSSEINQLVEMSFITKKQYYGVDRDRETIKKNRKIHPEAKWFHGEWEVLLCTKIIRPAMIYLDTTNFVGSQRVIRLTKVTMDYCPIGTFLFVNVMLNNPHHHNKVVLNKEEFITKLATSLTKRWRDKWEDYGWCLPYQSTKYTKMATYPLRRIA
jgi:hypothetical protein